MGHHPTPLANWASNDEKKNHKVLKDAYEKEVADIKEKRNNVWCHLALTLDAITLMLMLMRRDCMGDYGIGDRAKTWKLLQERFQSVETPTVVTSAARLARLQLEDSEDSFFVRVQELLTRLHEAVKQSQRPSSTLWPSMVCQWGMKGLLYRKSSPRKRTSLS